ncbi:MAG: hypothetical protein GDA45_06765 [Chromatiales bacterium]|nr:hypothetical protein [Chromatiales bacterium]
MWKVTPSSELVEIPASSHKSKEIVWLAMDELAFFQPTMPTKSKKSWRQTIPFALEDQLIAPIEKTHFAYDQNATEQVPVIAVSQRLMHHYTEAAQAEQLKPHKLIPELYALPYTDEKITIWFESDRCLMRDSYHSGNAGSVEWIAALVSACAHSAMLDIYSDNTKALPEAWQKDAKPLPASLDEMMARGAPVDAINLLQGEYGSSDAAAAYLKPWRVAIALAVVAFAAHLYVMFSDIQRYNLYQDNANRQTEQLAEQLQLPGGDPANLRTQVAQYIEQLRSYNQQRRENTWAILLRVDKLLSSCILCRVEKLELNGGTLTLNLSFAETGDDFKQKIENLAGFSVESKQLSDTAEGRRLMQFKLTEGASRSG